MNPKETPAPPLVVHGFETSNNMKVRVALGLQGVPYEFRTIDPADRTAIVELSGQHLTPVLEHGDVVLFDSGAILRYLHATFRDAPRLFGADRDEQWAIEDWELFARARLSGPMLEIVHTRVSGGTVDDAQKARCDAAFGEAVRELAEGLGSRPWLVGDGPTAADVTAAPVLHRVIEGGLLAVPPEAERLAAWRERVMAYDGVARLDAGGG